MGCLCALRYMFTNSRLSDVVLTTWSSVVNSQNADRDDDDNISVFQLRLAAYRIKETESCSVTSVLHTVKDGL